MHALIKQSPFATVSCILEAGADVNTEGPFNETALYFAGKRSCREIINLIKKNVINSSLSLLMHAVLDDDFEKVSYILQGRTDVNAIDSQGCTALMYALMNKSSIPIVKELLKAGADVNIKDSFNRTALTYAVIDGSEEILDCIIQEKVDVNSVCSEGYTILIYAIIHRRSTAIVKSILKAGVDVDKEDKAGRTAKDWAEREFCKNIVGCIEEHKQTLMVGHRISAVPSV